MTAFLFRHKNVAVFCIALTLQLVLLGVQARNRDEVRFFRVWMNLLIVPAEQITTSLSHSTIGLWDRYVALRHAASENKSLREEIQNLTLEKNRLEAEVQASKRLRALLDLKERVPSDTVAAQVIGSSPSEAFKTIILNKGALAGLTNNLPVITPEGIVGRIVQVSQRSSQVQLITDVESGVGVIFEKSRVHGVAKGTGNRQQLDVDYVVNEENISLGEVVRTSGEDQIYPKDLLVGTVTSVQSGKNIFKNITVAPAARVPRLEEVLVLKKPPTHD